MWYRLLSSKQKTVRVPSMKVTGPWPDHTHIQPRTEPRLRHPSLGDEEVSSMVHAFQSQVPILIEYENILQTML